MKDFLTHLRTAISEEIPIKMTLAKPRVKSDALRNVIIRPILLEGSRAYQATYRYQTKDQVKNYSAASLPAIIEGLLESQFLLADLFLPTQKISLLQSKKGRSKVILKKEASDITVGQHNKEKQRLIPPTAPYLTDLGLSSPQGHIYAKSQDKYKQINRYVELISGLIKDDGSVSKVVDMGSGKGYLTFALYDYMANTHQQELSITGVEIRPDLVNQCQRIADKHQLSGLTFAHGSIDDYAIPRTDMVIALHACDIATDMAIAKGLEAEASYIVVAPCCHKQIRKAMQKTNTALLPILRHGILKERTAEMITDTIRALYLEAKGYETKIFEFISSEHTGKNVMITAQKTGRASDTAIGEIAAIKREFGITEHYLETLISI